MLHVRMPSPALPPPRSNMGNTGSFMIRKGAYKLIAYGNDGVVIKNYNTQVACACVRVRVRACVRVCALCMCVLCMCSLYVCAPCACLWVICTCFVLACVCFVCELCCLMFDTW